MVPQLFYALSVTKNKYHGAQNSVMFLEITATQSQLGPYLYTNINIKKKFTQICGACDASV